MSRRTGAAGALGLAFAAGLACIHGAAADDAGGSAQLRIASVLTAEAELAPGEPMREAAALARFYAARSDRPAWLEQGHVRRDLGRELIAAVQQSEQHGLHPDAYHLPALAHALDAEEASTDRLADVDVLFSDAFLHLARHLAHGAVDPRELYPDYEPDRDVDAAEVLASALSSGDVGAALARMAPPHPEYAALTRALERLRAASASGDARAGARADQVRANLERWRWLPRDLGSRHLRVNTPTFTLRAYDRGTSVLEMRVVVGNADWTTPLAHGSISHLVLNPAWQVPRSIATREMLPAARRDAGYFRDKGIHVLVAEGNGSVRELDSRRIDWRAVDPDAFPYRLRQSPGPHNPLGRIKFVFTNPYGVYLHGTPGDLAFDRPARTLSHGCVRVEDEIALAAYALGPDPSWTHERLLESLRNAWEYRLPLPQPLPVHLLYFTVEIGSDGSPRFSGDPYRWDRALLAALDAESATGAHAARR